MKIESLKCAAWDQNFAPIFDVVFDDVRFQVSHERNFDPLWRMALFLFILKQNNLYHPCLYIMDWSEAYS